MIHYFHALPLRTLSHASSLHSIDAPPPLLLTDPATQLLTDFLRQKPVTLDVHTSVVEARLRLGEARTPLALAVNGAGDYVGVVTSGYLSSERPMGLASRRCGSVADIQVQEVMQPLHDLPAVHYRDFCTATVADLVSTFQRVRKPCLLVLHDEPESEALRGLVSSSEMKDRLNICLDLKPRATSFSEIVNAVQGRFD